MSSETDPSQSPSSLSSTPSSSTSPASPAAPASPDPRIPAAPLSVNPPPTSQPSANHLPVNPPNSNQRLTNQPPTNQPPGVLLLAVALILMAIGLALNLEWLGWSGCIIALLLSARIIWGLFKPLIAEVISPEQVTLIFALIGGLAALVGL